MNVSPLPHTCFRIFLDFGDWGDIAPGEYNNFEYAQREAQRYREYGFLRAKERQKVEKATVFIQTRNEVWNC